MPVSPNKVRVAHTVVVVAILLTCMTYVSAQVMATPQCKVYRDAMPDVDELDAQNKQRAQWLAQASDKPRLVDGPAPARVQLTPAGRRALDRPWEFGVGSSVQGVSGARAGASMTKNVTYDDGGNTYTLVATHDVRDSEGVDADNQRRYFDELGPEKNSLLVAIDKGDARALQRLIQGGADIQNTKDREGKKVALIARTLTRWYGRAYDDKDIARQNRDGAAYRAIVLALVDAGADVNESENGAPLWRIVSGNRDLPDPEGAQELTRYLLEHGAINSLHIIESAVMRGDVAMLDILLQHAKPTQEQLNGALAYAAARSRFDAAIHLLDAGADPQFRIDDTRPRALLKALVRNRVDFKAESLRGSQPLAFVMHDHELMRDFLDLGANPDLATQSANFVGDTALHLALRDRLDRPATPGRHAYTPAIRGNSVAMLLQYGASPDVRNGEGYTPLMLTSNEDAPAIELLLGAGATVNPDAGLPGERRRGGDAIGPVTWALLAGNETLATALVKRSRHLDDADCGALYYAAAGAATTTVQALLDLEDAPLSVKEGLGDTPLIAATRAGHIGVVEILLARKAANVNESTRVPFQFCLLCNLHASPPTGDITPLMVAAATGRMEMVKLLLQHGADLDRKDTTGRTAREYVSLVHVDAYRAMQGLLQKVE